MIRPSCAPRLVRNAYLFSTREPEEENGEGDGNEKVRRINEKPSLEGARTHGGKNGLDGANGSARVIVCHLSPLCTRTSATYRSNSFPKSVQNRREFRNDCETGTTDVIFHRIIKGFMIKPAIR